MVIGTKSLMTMPPQLAHPLLTSSIHAKRTASSSAACESDATGVRGGVEAASARDAFTSSANRAAGAAPLRRQLMDSTSSLRWTPLNALRREPNRCRPPGRIALTWAEAQRELCPWPRLDLQQ